MRARSSLHLILAGTLPLAVSGCSGPDDPIEVTAHNTFPTVQACTEAHIAADVCNGAYQQALVDHRASAPSYAVMADCEADFTPGDCEVGTDGLYRPKLGGFELDTTGEVRRADLDQAKAQTGGHGSFFNGLILGHLISSGFNRNQYFSQPVYRNRPQRPEDQQQPATSSGGGGGGYYGGSGYSSLSRQMEQGKTFSRSIQAAQSPSHQYEQSQLGRRMGAAPRASSLVSRGGFGSQATARSGWSGKSFSSGG